MNDFQIWLCIAGMTLVTILTRGAFLLFGAKMNLPCRLLSALKYAVPAALIVIIVPGLLTNSDGRLDIHLSNYQLIAACVSGIYFWFTRKMLGMLILGIFFLNLLRLCFG